LDPSKGIPSFNRFPVRLLIAAGLALPSYAFLLSIRNRPLGEIHFYAYAQYVLAVFLGLVVLFEIHHWKSRSLERLMPWNDRFNRRLWTEVLLAFFLSPPVTTGAYAALYLFVWRMPLYRPSIILYNVLGFFISLLFMAFVNIEYILSNWKQSMLRAESLEKEQIKAQLSELQNQISPHFLFNHFNILYSLIDEDPVRAKAFLDQLSEIYRYVLRQKNEELVKLSEELNFLDHYIFLIKTRFEDKINIHLELEDTQASFWIPPLSLQILLENAIKHNEASAERPLNITFRQSGDFLICTNDLQPKTGRNKGTQTGLRNIQKRIALLTDREMSIDRKEREFEVRLPLIRLSRS